MLNIGLIFYGAGNIGSVVRFFERFDGVRLNIVSRPGELRLNDVCIIPGVGHFGGVMEGLASSQLKNEILKFATLNFPIIGICAGAQVLMTGSDEAPGVSGLNLIPGDTCEIKKNFQYSGAIPRIGWQYVGWKESVGKTLGLPINSSCYYFAHSYEMIPQNKDNIVATSFDGVVAVIKRGKIWGLQFHPEKSQADGFKLVHSILECYA